MGKDRIEEAKRKPSRRVKSSRGVADYAVVPSETLSKAIAAVAMAGGALRLGYTADGGAYAIGVYGDGDPYTDYVKPDEDVAGYFEALIDAWGT